mgnify:CR=1 FL=1
MPTQITPRHRFLPSVSEAWLSLTSMRCVRTQERQSSGKGNYYVCPSRLLWLLPSPCVEVLNKLFSLEKVLVDDEEKEFALEAKNLTWVVGIH